MTKTYLLGAGASVGYTDSKPLELRPPRSKDFFLRGRDFGILNKNDLPNLYDALSQYLNHDEPLEQVAPDDLRVDIEEFLKTIDGSDSDFDVHTNKAFGECIYFIYELLRHHQMLYRPNVDNYSRLARHHFDQGYNVISLNYDIFFELAASSVGLGVSYGLTGGVHGFNRVPIAKPHGSVNWLTKMIGFGARSGDKIGGIAQMVYGISVSDSNNIAFDTMSQDLMAQLKHQDLVRSNADFFFPTLIPPVAKNKNYDQFDVYNTVQNFTRSMLSVTEDLVIIGCSLREEDELLLEMLNDELYRDVSVKIVARSSNDEVADTIRDIRGDAEIDTTHEEFGEYARTL